MAFFTSCGYTSFTFDCIFRMWRKEIMLTATENGPHTQNSLIYYPGKLKVNSTWRLFLNDAQFPRQAAQLFCTAPQSFPMRKHLRKTQNKGKSLKSYTYECATVGQKRAERHTIYI